MIADLIGLGALLVLAFYFGYAKGSEFTLDRIRTKFLVKEKYSNREFMDIIEEDIIEDN